MNPSRVKMLEEHDSHFVCHDGKASFRVPKKGLSEALHEKIRKMAAGGTVDELPPREGADVGTPMPLLASYQPPPQMGPEYRPALIPAEPVSLAMEDQPGFDKAAYENAKRGKFPAGGPEAYQQTRMRAADLDKEAEHKAAIEALGIRPAETKPAVPVQTSVQAPPARSTGARGPESAPGLAEETAGLAEKMAGATALQSAEAQQARAKAAALGAAQTQLEHDAVDQRTRAANADLAGKAALAKVNAAIDDAKSIDTTVDPGRFWASRTTPQKITGIIGLVLGSLGARPDGINQAAQMLTTAIDRDIEAQKAEHRIRMEKGQQAIEGARSMYGMQRQLVADDAAAHAAARATGKELAANQLEQADLSVADAAGKAKLQLLIGGLRDSAAKDRNDVYFKTRDANTKQQIANADMIRATRPAAQGANAGKQTGLMNGAIDAANALEKEILANPLSPRIGQLRASFMLHLNKIQGGRFNKEIHEMNQALTPGNEGASAWQRGQAAFDPAATKKKFDILRRHVYETGGVTSPDEADE